MLRTKRIAITAVMLFFFCFLRTALAQETATTEVGSNFYLTKGIECIGDGRFEEAISQFKEAIVFDSENAYAYKLFGLTYFELGNNEDGEANMRRAIELYKSEEENEKVRELSAFLESKKISDSGSIEKEPLEGLKRIQDAQKVNLIIGSYSYIACNSTLDCNVKLDLTLASDNWKYRSVADEEGEVFCAEAQGESGPWLIRESGEPTRGTCQ